MKNGVVSEADLSYAIFMVRWSSLHRTEQPERAAFRYRPSKPHSVRARPHACHHAPLHR
jgi:hypothetical protein